MDRTERFYKIDQLLHSRSVVPLQIFLDELDISHATFKRDLEYLRDRLHAPIVWDRDAGGYRFVQAKSAKRYELPGLWFSSEEVVALLSMQQLLNNLEPGLLTPKIEPLKARLMALLSDDVHLVEEIESRLKIVHAVKRPIKVRFFEQLASATIKRQRLVIGHYHREKNQTLTREVSPQQLVFYRGNWYLDAWCHLRKAIRTFAVESIISVELLNTVARDVAKAVLKNHFHNGYGIFSGEAVEWAVLKFKPENSRWVAQEVWHPEQKSTIDGDGNLLLEVPFTDDKELVMDILKHGDGVEVLAPLTLQQRVVGALNAAALQYRTRLKVE